MYALTSNFFLVVVVVWGGTRTQKILVKSLNGEPKNSFSHLPILMAGTRLSANVCDEDTWYQPLQLRIKVFKVSHSKDIQSYLVAKIQK